MKHREQVAHHEAAHAVMAHFWGWGVAGDIDLDAATSVEDAYGTALINIVDYDAALSEAEQRKDLTCNLSIFCAGAASDAKIKQIDPAKALHAQPGDHGKAMRHALANPLVANEEEAQIALSSGLATAVFWLDQPHIWSRVERVAAAALEAGGKLGKAEIEALCKTDDPASSDPQTPI